MHTYYTHIFRLALLVAAANASALQLVQRLQQRLLVLEAQLLGDDIEIAHRIHFALHMNHIRIVEGAAQMEDRIAGANVRQERIAEALAFGGALHQAGDVDDIEEGGHFAAAAGDFKFQE